MRNILPSARVVTQTDGNTAEIIKEKGTLD
jgi:hypothetical protein